MRPGLGDLGTDDFLVAPEEASAGQGEQGLHPLDSLFARRFGISKRVRHVEAPAEMPVDVRLKVLPQDTQPQQAAFEPTNAEPIPRPPPVDTGTPPDSQTEVADEFDAPTPSRTNRRLVSKADRFQEDEAFERLHEELEALYLQSVRVNEQLGAIERVTRLTLEDRIDQLVGRVIADGHFTSTARPALTAMLIDTKSPVLRLMRLLDFRQEELEVALYLKENLIFQDINPSPVFSWAQILRMLAPFAALPDADELVEAIRDFADAWFEDRRSHFQDARPVALVVALESIFSNLERYDDPILAIQGRGSELLRRARRTRGRTGLWRMKSDDVDFGLTINQVAAIIQGDDSWP
jgi:hypothetical protein